MNIHGNSYSIVSYLRGHNMNSRYQSGSKSYAPPDLFIKVILLFDGPKKKF